MNKEHLGNRWLKLTKSVIDELKYEGHETSPGKYSRDIRWDEMQRGLGVRLFPSGEKSYVMRYRINGHDTLKSIGPCARITLEQARRAVQAKFGTLALGEDPFKGEKTEITRITFKTLAAEYIQLYAKPHKKTWQNDEARLKRYVLPRWGGRLVSEIGNSDVIKLHYEISKTAPYEANRTVEVLSVMFRLAIQWGAYGKENPAKGIKQNRERKRDRWITPDELKRIAIALDSEESIYAAQAIWMYLYTGARKSELLKAKWKDVDFERRELRFVDTKNGETHYVPLSEPAMQILRELPRAESNPHIFPGAVKGACFVNLSKAWARIKKEADVTDVRLHDLRRTVGSWLAQAGNSLHLIGRVLNHKNPATTAVYARFSQDLVRQALEDHGRRVLAAIGKGTVGEVVPFDSQSKVKKHA